MLFRGVLLASLDAYLEFVTARVAAPCPTTHPLCCAVRSMCGANVPCSHAPTSPTQVPCRAISSPQGTTTAPQPAPLAGRPPWASAAALSAVPLEAPTTVTMTTGACGRGTKAAHAAHGNTAAAAAGAVGAEAEEAAEAAEAGTGAVWQPCGRRRPGGGGRETAGGRGVREAVVHGA